jgi:hypothetical protein
MTVSSTTTKVSFSGDGTTSAFAYSFKIFLDTELKVIVRTDSTGAEVTKTINTDYLVSNAGEQDGGTVTFKFDTGNSDDSNYDTTDRRPQSGETVLLKRVMTLTQNTDYTPNDSFPAAAHEDALDKLTFINQQQQEELDRTFKFAETDVDAQDLPASAERANKYLGFNSEGNAIAVDGTTNATTISTFGATLVDDANASAARTTLGLGSLAVLSAVADDSVTNAMMANDSVGADELIDNSVGAAAINISGNGSSGQRVVSDGDGSFSYSTFTVATVQRITSSGTWNKPSGCMFVRVTVVGGGGGGGGLDGNSNNQELFSGSGGGGGTAISMIDVSSVSSVSVTVGAGGAGGATANDGATGGTSSFGSYLSATGGLGGQFIATANEITTSGVPGIGGEGSSGNILNARGGVGHYIGRSQAPGGRNNNTTQSMLLHGGSTLIGNAVFHLITDISTAVATNGTEVTPDANTGVGGSGARTHDRTGSNGHATGGSGASGVVIVEEFYS